jgi:hypothetical protein
MDLIADHCIACSRLFSVQLRSMLQICERAESGRDYEPDGDEPEFVSGKNFVDAEQKKSQRDGEIPPGVKGRARLK